ncbi:MAG: hypothetical protein LQ351_002922 [Letrouitia transgressa]|nr:MAG: hypothetical protein LQ351_002922 [Letrouitia transgressa]
MKDLYTFDSTHEDALQTYERVRHVYDAFFSKFNIPFITAEADSGGIGGDLSHEYHFITPNGEDTIIGCDSCGYVTNEELARSVAGPNVWQIRRKNKKLGPAVHEAYRSWFGVSSDRSLVVEAVFPKDVEIRKNNGIGFRGAEANPYILKSIFPTLDLRTERPMRAFTEYWSSVSLDTVAPTTAQPKLPHLVQVFDYRIPQSFINDRFTSQKKWSPLYKFFKTTGLTITSSHASPDLVRIGNHDPCPKCAKPSLRVQRAIELGHTFYLGTRYSTPLHATITPKPAPRPSTDDDNGSTNADRPPAPKTKTNNNNIPQRGGNSNSSVPLQMGCHGIGISRMIAALADALSDSKGLAWPRIVAPFEVVIIASKGYEREAAQVYDSLRVRALGERETDDDDNDAAIDVVLDDRDKSFAWKLKDADLIGYPVVVLLGSTFREQGKCEVAARRLGRRESFQLEDVRRHVGRLLAEL